MKHDEKARLETLLYSTGGVIALVVILILANFVLGKFKQRVDLTDGRLYTLTSGTRAVIDKLEAPVRVRFYFSQGEGTLPLQVKAFGRRVEDLLAEYRQQGGDKVIIEKLDPKPDSDAEDAAELDGVEPQTLQTGDKFYLGLAISYAGQRLAIPALSLDREELLEYDLTRAIARAANPEKPVIGVMSAMPLFGSRGMPQRGIPPSDKQVLISELERDFIVRRIEMNPESIPEDIKVLLVVHPRDIQDKGLYAIDQYVMRGGKLVAMMDPFSYFDAQYAPQAAQGAAGTASTLDKLTRAWGITMDGTRVLSDTRYTSGQGPRAMPTVLTLLQDAFNKDDVATRRLSNLLLPFPGAFTGKPAEGLTQTVLVKSSTYSKLVESADATKAGSAALSGFQPSNTEFPLVMKLTGKFKSAFPDGRPVEVPKDKDDKGGAKPPAALTSAAKPAAKAAGKDEGKPAAAPAHLVQSGDTAVVLIADADFVNDGAAVEIQEVFGQRIVVPSNGNLALTQALIEQFAGDPNLITVRSRAVVLRPFTMIRAMEAEAQQAFTGKIKDLETQVQQSSQKLQALQQQRTPGQQASTILTPEQQAEIDKFKAVSTQARRELKEVRKDLRADSESLMFWTKVINIGLVPLLIVLAGVFLALYRRRRVVTL